MAIKQTKSREHREFREYGHEIKILKIYIINFTMFQISFDSLEQAKLKYINFFIQKIELS